MFYVLNVFERNQYKSQQEEKDGERRREPQKQKSSVRVCSVYHRLVGRTKQYDTGQVMIINHNSDSHVYGCGSTMHSAHFRTVLPFSSLTQTREMKKSNRVTQKSEEETNEYREVLDSRDENMH